MLEVGSKPGRLWRPGLFVFEAHDTAAPRRDRRQSRKCRATGGVRAGRGCHKRGGKNVVNGFATTVLVWQAFCSEGPRLPGETRFRRVGVNGDAPANGETEEET
jgi:hypothetical protein